MKKLIFIIVILTLGVACENEPGIKPEIQTEVTEKDSIQNYQGNFISVGSEAVLKGENFVYQVKMDSMANLLKESLKEYQLDDMNIIPVEVKGKVIDNKLRKGYSKLIEIREIVEIFARKQSENTEIKK
ncbi:MAG TPA: hypothetical protein VFD29_11005 [Gillisia sp.]|nr:hypothetical protein [Gillisia sp.]